MTDTERVIQLVTELRGVVCRCGRAKVAKQTLCRACYAKLPMQMQRALYRFIGEGYEEAYDAAASFLDEAKRKDDAKIARLTA